MGHDDVHINVLRPDGGMDQAGGHQQDTDITFPNGGARLSVNNWDTKVDHQQAAQASITVHFTPSGGAQPKVTLPPGPITNEPGLLSTNDEVA